MQAVCAEISEILLKGTLNTSNHHYHNLFIPTSLCDVAVRNSVAATPGYPGVLGGTG